MSAIVVPTRVMPADLPDTLPIFPLSGALLLPQARLPLNVFEPRYLAMIEDSLGKGRIIGMIQPTGSEEGKAPLYSIGCAGRITSFNETEDGRLMIVLTGICRFRIVREVPQSRLYRVAVPDWQPYLGDLEATGAPIFDRARLLNLLQDYFKKHSIQVDWTSVQNAPDEVLLPTVMMICPLAANEKQALLEAANDTKRAQMLITLLEMACAETGESADGDITH
jgi:Lon protease-like protein